MDSVQFLKNSRPLEPDSGKYVKVLFDAKVFEAGRLEGNWQEGGCWVEPVGDSTLVGDGPLLFPQERIPFINLLLAGPRSEKVKVTDHCSTNSTGELGSAS